MYGGAGDGDGIYDESASLIENVEAYANQGVGIYSFNNSNSVTPQPGTITGSTVFGNLEAGIQGLTALISDNLVYSQISPTWDAIELDGPSTGIGNTVFGGTSGIFVDGTAEAIGNLVYDISGDGIYYRSGREQRHAQQGGPAVDDRREHAVRRQHRIQGSEYAHGTTIAIDGNLIYQNASAGISLLNGIDQSIVNNTIDQPTGTGISISGAASATSIENNIIDVGAGPPIAVSPASETGFASDYNLFDLTGTASVVGTWEGISFASLPNWYSNSVSMRTARPAIRALSPPRGRQRTGLWPLDWRRSDPRQQFRDRLRDDRRVDDHQTVGYGGSELRTAAGSAPPRHGRSPA